MDEAKFDQWALVELFGHSRIAGRVTEQQIGGASFIRVDVPELEIRRPEQRLSPRGRIPVEHRDAFTRLFGPGAIYAITPVSEEVARQAAAGIRPEPINVWIPNPQGRMLPAYDEGDGEREDG